MKSIITFSLALLATVAAHAATDSGLSEIDTVTGNGSSLRAKFVNEDAVLNPSAYISSGYIKSQEDTAKDNALITGNEATEKAPLYFETSVKEINENNRITEAQLPEYAPLDFNYINKAQEKLSIPAAWPKL